MRTVRRMLARTRIALDRPRLWRVTAALAVGVLCVVLVGAAQGSIDVVPSRPAGALPSGGASWERWCMAGRVREDRRRLAFCARVNGLVLAATHGPGRGETHVAVVGGFHLTIVRLPDGTPTPSFGSRVVAIGPLLRARNGQREVQAFKLVNQ